MSDKILKTDGIPQDIVDAAVKISSYLESIGTKDWCFMGICDRSFSDRLYEKEKENEELKRLSHYFRREGGLDGGSEVDRLKTIIHELDRRKTQMTLERNAVWAAITEAEERGKDCVLISDVRKHEVKLKQRYDKVFNELK